MDDEQVRVPVGLPRRLMFRWAWVVVGVVVAGVAAGLWVYRNRAAGAHPREDGVEP
jgi:uncharacterized membrane protein YczE